MEQTKKCTKCGEVKSLSDFYTMPRNADGKHGSCIVCYKKRVNDRYNLLVRSPEFVESEKTRARDKYHRLYSMGRVKIDPLYKSKMMKLHREKYPEKYAARSASQHIECEIGCHKHHWSYNQEHYMDVIEITSTNHATIHRHMIYDQERMMYRTTNGILLDTKESHIEYAKSVGVSFK